ncbi:sensor histidine kinase [Mycolicibacterium bacteremicum]|uniref:histidine kinase n=1 Tax=Mycolicibacterium bacteremicum TaxID=564198 RepID=A0A1W9YSW9_MYCBA|nr:histidine kinase [Mycolicibacterium bacteremicum]MCV7431190.1 sensor histidine kinase [Mycolicibacterium bacteremicum]ORA02860.1 sensor histidine kinase [Mycolicibacterium bacteremicum]
MVAITSEPPVTVTAEPPARRRIDHIGVVPTASMLTGAFAAVVWLWIPLSIIVIGVSSIFSIVGFLLAGVVFVYLMRGVEKVERVRSEAVFGLQIPVPPRARTGYTGFQGWAHQLWLDISGTRFWKATSQHFLRMLYDLLAVGLAMALLSFAFLGPAAALAIQRSDDDAGLRFLSPVLTWVLAVLALVAAVVILILAPALDARIDRWLLSASPTAALKHEVSALSQARAGALTSAQTERHRIERDLHDSVQPRLVSLAMTIGLAQTKLDNDPSAARTLISEAHTEAMSALAELRNVVRGIAPTILSDRGLDAALSAVVQRTETAGVPTTLDIHLPYRLPAEVEACAYFVVAEALTNVAKHAGAGQAVVTVRLDEASNSLYVTIFDDGRGGAHIGVDEDATGLRGLAERVRAARGTFDVSSPVTGPTIVTAVLPCAS